MALMPMTVTRLKVSRVMEFGAFLDAGTGQSTDDILLHKNQQTTTLEVGDEVEVMLYLDPKRRLSASMRVPSIVEGEMTDARILSTTRDGAFVDLGAERGIFLPFSEMIGRPRENDVVRVKLYRDKSGRLAVSMKAAARASMDRSERIEVEKVDQIDRDAERLLKYMMRSNGFISEKLPPSFIQKNFRISKGAFKRALGHLYKMRRIERSGDGFKLTDEARGDA